MKARMKDGKREFLVAGVWQDSPFRKGEVVEEAKEEKPDEPEAEEAEESPELEEESSE